MDLVSRLAFSTSSSERNLVSVLLLLRRIRRRVWTMPRQFPGVMCCMDMTRYKSFPTLRTMPLRISVAFMLRPLDALSTLPVPRLHLELGEGREDLLGPVLHESNRQLEVLPR